MGDENKIKPTYVDFDYDNYKWKSNIDYRKNPHLYNIGRGQQGVLTCEPYKSELCPLWFFKTPAIAQKSAEMIYEKFLKYMEDGDFVGADMAKKYLHMGFTRARRYWNHSSGKKWTKVNGEWKQIDKDHSEERYLKASNIFGMFWKRARENKRYLNMKKNFKKMQKKA